MIWRIFSGLVGVCSFVAVSLGVGSADAPTPWKLLGYLGAVFIAVAVGSYAASLPSRPSAHRMKSDRTESTIP